MTFDLNTLQSGSSYLAERNRWFVVAWSETGLGKSYFSMGFPTPIYILSLETDGPFSALRRKVLKDNLNPNDVFITEAWQQCFDGKPPFIRLQQHYNKMWQFCLDWIKCVSEMAPEGTIVIDTASNLWNICSEVTVEPRKRIAEERNQKFLQFEWKYANNAFLAPFESLRATNLNLLMLNHASEIHNSKGQSTGMYKYHGNKKALQDADLVVRIGVDQNPKTGGVDRRWLLVEKCRDDNDLIGAVITDVNFKGVKSMLEGTEIPTERMKILIGDNYDKTLDEEEE